MEVKEAAKERFYSLVEQVYLYKLENGEFNYQDYNDISAAVDDVMRAINENRTEEAGPSGKWNESMVEEHKKVIQDFKNGIISWADISMQ